MNCSTPISSTASPQPHPQERKRLTNPPVLRVREGIDLVHERSGLSAEATESGGSGEADCGG
jgi:hypothetical protein